MKKIFNFILLILIISSINCGSLNNKEPKKEPKESESIPSDFAIIKGKLEPSEGIDASQIRSATVYIAGQEENSVETDNKGNFILPVDLRITPAKPSKPDNNKKNKNTNKTKFNNSNNKNRYNNRQCNPELAD